MLIRYGRYGDYLACAKDKEECGEQRPILKITGVKCPRAECGGEIVEKKSRRGKIFYGCSNYSQNQCTSAYWYPPADFRWSEQFEQVPYMRHYVGLQDLEARRPGRLLQQRMHICATNHWRREARLSVLIAKNTVGAMQCIALSLASPFFLYCGSFPASKLSRGSNHWDTAKLLVAKWRCDTEIQGFLAAYSEIILKSAG